MKDLRQSNIHVSGIIKINGLDINEDTVKQMFVTLGIKPEPTLIQEAIGYLSSNGMQFTISNLYDFLRSKSIVSMVDLRKKKTIAKNKIVTLDIPINNSKIFNDNMYQKGYSDFTRDFLIKRIANIEINITRNNTLISAITGYDIDRNVIDIPTDIITIVNNDITESNK